MRRMHPRVVVAMATAALILAACGTESADPAPAPTPAPAPAPAPTEPGEPTLPEPETKQVIVGASGSGISQLAWIEAIERLNAQGWEIQYVEAGSNLNQQGVDSGQFDFGLGSTPAALRILNEGRRTLTHIMDLVELDWAAYGVKSVEVEVDGVATTKSLDSLCDFNGEQFAVHSFSSITYVLPAYFVSSNCFTVKPDWLIVPGSDNRLVALLNGDILASTLELADAIALEAEDTEGRFQRIITFADSVNVIGSAVSVNADFAATNPGTVMNMMAEVLLVSREMNASPAEFKTIMLKHLPEYEGFSGLDEIVEEYAERQMLSSNGGFAVDKIEESLRFYSQSGIVGPELTVDDVADRSFLEQVLEIIGEA